MKLPGGMSPLLRGTVAGATWQLLEQCVHMLLLFAVKCLLRAANTAYLRSIIAYLGLAAVLAEAEKPGTLPAGRGRAAGVAAAATLLPHRAKDDQHRLTIVLDLDETLVCAYNAGGMLPGVHKCAVAGGVRWFVLQCVAALPGGRGGGGKPRVNNVVVYERPGLRDFLAQAAEVGELVVFTAGLEGYARPLLDRIDADGRVSARLYRPATVSTQYREHVKDLSRLGRDLARTVIVDNNPFSFVLQPRNGIPCVPFTGEATEDRQLLDVLLPLLRQLSAAPDVRPVLLERFHMPTWFANRGAAVS